MPYLVLALDLEGKYAQSLPNFGGERRGSPVKVSLRISDEPIVIREAIAEPSCIVVLDTKLMAIVNVAAGLRPGGIAVLNTVSPPDEVDLGISLSITGTLDATAISEEVFGRRPIPLTCMPMLGGFAAATGWIGIDSIADAVSRKMDAALVRNSLRALRVGYEATRVEGRYA